MDVFQTVSGYINKMVSAGDGLPGQDGPSKMKILLLDSETVCPDPSTNRLYQTDVIKIPILSSSTSQSTLLNHHIYLTECVVLPHDAESHTHHCQPCRKLQSREDATPQMPLLPAAVLELDISPDR